MEDRQKTCLCQRQIERHSQLQSKAGLLTDCLSGMENTLSCLQANCYDDLAAVDRRIRAPMSERWKSDRRHVCLRGG